MKPSQYDLCAAVAIIGYEEHAPLPRAVIGRLAELELIEIRDGKPTLTEAGDRLFKKIEVGGDIAEFA